MFHSIDMCMGITPMTSDNRDLFRGIDLLYNNYSLDLYFDISIYLDQACGRARARAFNLYLAPYRAHINATLFPAVDLQHDLALARYIRRELNLILDIEHTAFQAILRDDINNIASGRYEELSNDTSVYGEYWDDFHAALAECGCKYWADVYADLWERKFQPDTEELAFRLELPNEYLNKGAAEAAEYLMSAKRVGIKTLREARMLILGDAASGKTSFARRFVDINAELPKKSESTRGVDIDYNNHKPISLKAAFPDMAFEHDVNLHIWDFAGQTAMHPIHSLFLSENCVYVLVYDGRTETSNNLRYWLEKIRQFGKNSKVFILVNLYDAHEFDKSFNKEQREFAANNIDIVKASIGYDKWEDRDDEAYRKDMFDQVRKKVAQSIAEQRKPLAKHIVRAKEYLDTQFNDSKTYIKLEEFICEIAKMMEQEFPNEARDAGSIRGFLSTFLHTLGIALYYKDMDGFDQIVLNPMWIAGAVYEVVDHLKFIRESRITKDDIKAILTNNKRKKESFTYTETDIEYIYELLLKYNLAYEYSKDTLILPICMSDDEPPFALQPPFPDGETLVMLFRAQNKKDNRLEPMPEEVIPKFIVAVHENIYEKDGRQFAWRKGVILKKGQAIAKAEKTDYSTITLSAVDKNGGARYLRELRELLEKVLWQVNMSSEHTQIIYKMIDTDGRITGEYRDDYTANAETLNIYGGSPIVHVNEGYIVAEHIEKMQINKAYLKVPEKLTGEMIAEFKAALDAFLQSELADKLTRGDSRQLENDIQELNEATENEKPGIVKRIVEFLNRPEVSAAANLLQIVGVSLTTPWLF